MMDRAKIKERLKKQEKLKRFVLNLMIHPQKARPRWWLRLFQPFYMKRGKKSVIYRSVRKDIAPFNHFSLGDYSVIEDFSTITNLVGDVIVGSRSRVGLGNVIIGPVTIGNDVNLAQNIAISGLNHRYQEVDRTISLQGVETTPVTIHDDVWIGANSVVLAGVTIGEHVVIGAGSVVTRDIPPYTVALGNPARVVKEYDFQKGEWVKSAQR